MWGMLASAGLGALGSIGGALIGSASSSKSNRLAIQFAREQAQNRYQWAVRDMEKAGLNPKLAGTQNASVSAGGSPSLRDPGAHITQGLVNAGQILANAVGVMSSANKNNAEAALAGQQALTQSSARDQMEADAALKRHQAFLVEAQALEVKAREAKTREERQYWLYEAWRARELAQREYWRNDYVEKYRYGALGEHWRDNARLLSGLEVFGSSARDAAGVFDKTVGRLLERLVPDFKTLVDLTTDKKTATSVTPVGGSRVTTRTQRRVLRK